MNCLQIRNLSKSYGKNVALSNIDLCFEEGKIYGLLGRNGAGKSTLLNILASRIFADSGECTINGIPLRDNDPALGLLYLQSEQTLYPPKMDMVKVLQWTQKFYPDFDMGYAERLMKLFGLEGKKEVRSLSTGYDTIFKLIVALSTNAPYIFLDEPVLGLDANHRDLFYKAVIEKFANNPAQCIVISTHLVEEVSPVIEDVVIIKQGKILRNTSRDELLQAGYSISGLSVGVDTFIADKNILGADTLGGLKTAYVLGQPPVQVPQGLEISRMDLQRLFIQLTSDENTRGV